nr:hypothetical protein [Acetobacter pasteurianus]
MSKATTGPAKATVTKTSSRTAETAAWTTVAKAAPSTKATIAWTRVSMC